MTVYVNPGALVHWWFGIEFGQGGFCEEYAMGDTVIDATTGTGGDVTCQECLEWVHA